MCGDWVYKKCSGIMGSDDVERLECAEKSIGRWMCNIIVRDSQISEELKSRLGINSISKAMRTGRLH